MKKLLLTAATLIAAFAFTSCNNNGGGNYPGYLTNLATVQNPDENINYVFTLDNDTRMSIASTNVLNYRPKTGQRILADYNIMQKAPESAGYDYDVRLYDVYEILTKDIVEITDENEAAIGNDPYYDARIWVGSNWLNVEFIVLGQGNKKHFINVVEDKRIAPYEDGKIYLQLRQNADGDVVGRQLWGMASFDLTPYKKEGATEVKLVVNAKLPGHEGGKNFEVTYKFDNVPEVLPFNGAMRQEEVEVE